jgi:hypothetical protein
MAALLQKMLKMARFRSLSVFKFDLKSTSFLAILQDPAKLWTCAVNYTLTFESLTTNFTENVVVTLLLLNWQICFGLNILG